MKPVLLLLFIAVFSSCSSKQKPINALTLDYNYKSRVQIEDKDGKLQTVKYPGSKSINILDPKTGQQYKSAGWLDPTTYNQTPGSHLKKLSNNELFLKAKRCTRYEAVLIIDEVRSRRKATGVKVLAHFLMDKRLALFSKKRNYWWYEEKGKDYETVEVRTYSAFALQEYLKEYPLGLALLINHDEYLFYGVKNRFAVSKEDVCKIWLNWWKKNQKDYL